MKTLLLTPWMAPARVVSWQTAVVMVLAGKVTVVAEYDEVCRSPSTALPIPAVIVQRRAVTARRTTRFNRANVYQRDAFRCQYCGATGVRLSFDHVVPRARGGRRTWENIVASCLVCNRKKGCRTPEEAGMRLLRAPTRPTYLPLAALVELPADIPDLWAPFVRTA